MAFPIEQYIRQGLIARGLPPHVADGFVMNFKDESNLNPGINEANPTVPGSRGGFGLYQLTGPRRVAYERYAAQRGVNPSDTDAQLDFLMLEGQGPEKAAFNAILAAPDTGSAASAIVTKFLRPAPEHQSSRVAKYSNMADGPKGQEMYKPVFGSMSPGHQPPDTNIDPAVATYAFGDDKPRWGDRLSAAGKAFDRAANEYPAPRTGGGGGDARQTGNALANVLNNPTVADILLKKRAPFLFG